VIGRSGDLESKPLKRRGTEEAERNRVITLDWGDRVMGKTTPTYPRNKSEEFLSGSDPWVIAYALRHAGTVVTQESSSRKRKVRIPVVCQEFNVRCIDTFEMLKLMKASFAK
jgi:hypothetical protein